MCHVKLHFLVKSHSTSHTVSCELTVDASLKHQKNVKKSIKMYNAESKSVNTGFVINYITRHHTLLACYASWIAQNDD